MQPAFGQERVARLVPTLVSVIERRAECWERSCRDGVTVEMEAEMLRQRLPCHTAAILGSIRTYPGFRDGVVVVVAPAALAPKRIFLSWARKRLKQTLNGGRAL
jgi:hypothetical protein